MASKRLRFEMFKRDGFTCQYCGRRPPEVVLELDHINPRAAGGTDDEINLITSCMDCNRGKSDKKLGDVRPRPDADLKYLELQQELAEADRYLMASQALQEKRMELIDRLEAVWTETISEAYRPTDKQWGIWLTTFAPDEIEFAIRQTSRKFNSGKWGWGMNAANQAIRYASGVMNGVRKQASGESQVQ